MAGPSLRAFDEYMAQNKGLPRLINLPAFADDDKRHLLAAADVVAQPSRVESLGIVLLEAWANAKPVIAADIPVSRRLVEETKGGMVVRFGDSAQLAEAIGQLLADDELRQRMGRSAQPHAMEHEGAKMWQRNAQEFEVLAGSQTRLS